jgi:hypothetical protein
VQRGDVDYVAQAFQPCHPRAVGRDLIAVGTHDARP